jgi:hypothetical protein
MEAGTTVSNLDLISIQPFIKNPLYPGFQVNSIGTNRTMEILVREGCENFYNYIDWLGLAKNSGITVLSSSHHYFYDAEDLEGIEILVNQKQLNHITQIRNFLHNIHHILPQKAYFVGCFYDNKNQNGSFFDLFKPQNLNTDQAFKLEDAYISRIPLINKMYDLFDSRTNRYMTKRNATLMLEGAGLKVSDMTDLDNITYFCAHKSKSTIR